MTEALADQLDGGEGFVRAVQLVDGFVLLSQLRGVLKYSMIETDSNNILLVFNILVSRSVIPRDSEKERIDVIVRENLSVIEIVSFGERFQPTNLEIESEIFKNSDKIAVINRDAVEDSVMVIRSEKPLVRDHERVRRSVKIGESEKDLGVVQTRKNLSIIVGVSDKFKFVIVDVFGLNEAMI